MYTYIYTDPDSYEPLHRSTGSTKTVKAANKPTTSTATKLASQDLTDKDDILLWFGEYIAWKNHYM